VLSVLSREQCEEAVDYHGFCVANSNVPNLNNQGPQRLFTEASDECDFRVSPAAKLLSRDEARRIATNVAKLRELRPVPMASCPAPVPVC
jgi:hypothetical protein